MSKEISNPIKFYCVKCRVEREILQREVVRESKPKGPDMLRSKCPTCGGKLVKFVKRQAP